jgi:anti-anti-sigma regulatory factor
MGRRVRRRLAVDCSALTVPDLAGVELLAALQLAAKRHGWQLQPTNVSRELHDLLLLAGLTGVLGLEPQRQAEQGEEPRGVEEEGDLFNLLP